MNQKQSFYYLLVATLLIRVFTVLFINHIPCMEPAYLSVGRTLYSGSKTVVTLSPLYSLIVYAFSTLFGSLKIAANVIYIVGSFLTVFYLAQITRFLFNERATMIVLLLAIFFPNLTTAVAGYSHSVVLGNAIEFASLFYLLKFYSTGRFKLLLTTTILAAISIALRPETLIMLCLFFIAVLIYDVAVKKKNSYTALAKATCFYFIFIGMFMAGHQYYVASHSAPGAHPGTFTDNVYSYGTFIDTYGMRYDNEQMTRSVGIEKSIPFVGTPEQNDYKILNAIRKNPKQFLSNILYMTHYILKQFAHPLFIPFFLYCFLGLMLFNAQNVIANKQALAALLLLMLLHLIPLLIFHVEIRYMQQLCLLFLILIAFNISLLSGKTYKISIIGAIAGIVIIYAMYAITNHAAVSLCG